LTPIEEVAMGVPVLSKAKMDDGLPFSKFQPRVVEAMTPPVELPARILFAGTARYELPMVVEATPFPLASPAWIPYAADFT
jgi:hypothetical protein